MPQRKSGWEQAKEQGQSVLVVRAIGALIIVADLLVFVTGHVLVPLIVTARTGEAFEFEFQLLEVGVHAIFLLAGMALLNLTAAKSLASMVTGLPFFGGKK
jgi:hypothetical protein